MRSTFKVLFYVNGSKEKNGLVPIMGRVTINGSVAQFSCKQTIAKELWDAKGNRAKERAGKRGTLISPWTTLRPKSSSTISVFQTGKRSLRLKWYAMPFKGSVRNTKHFSVRSIRTTRVSGSVSV